MNKIKLLLLIFGLLNISVSIAQTAEPTGTIEIRAKIENLTGVVLDVNYLDRSATIILAGGSGE